MHNLIRHLALAMILILVASTSLASSLRCGRDVITEGDIHAYVLDKCGEPTYKASYQREIFLGDRLVDDRRIVLRKIIIIDEWTYNFGPRNFLYIVVLENGKVVEIRTEGFGYID